MWGLTTGRRHRDGDDSRGHAKRSCREIPRKYLRASSLARSKNLPSNAAGGGIDTLALLAPGVVPGLAGNSNGTTLSVNGNRSRSNNFTIDGQDNNDLAVAGPSYFRRQPGPGSRFPGHHQQLLRAVRAQPGSHCQHRDQVGHERVSRLGFLVPPRSEAV